MMTVVGLLLLPLALLGRRERRVGMKLLLMIAAVAAVSGLAGCGATRIIPLSTGGGGGGSSPTPSGTYNLTVTGSAAGLSHSVGLTLVVQ